MLRAGQEMGFAWRSVSGLCDTYIAERPVIRWMYVKVCWMCGCGAIQKFRAGIKGQGDGRVVTVVLETVIAGLEFLRLREGAHCAERVLSVLRVRIVNRGYH